jgi:cytoskeletal protein CcmA (bactofilin family)
MKRAFSSFIVGLILVVTASTAAAATFQSGDSVSVTVPVGDDLYAAGGAVEIAEQIDGDLLVAGGQVTVRGRVTGDIAAAGGNVRIRGDVGDDVRVSGGQVEVRGTINDDLIMVGGQVELDAESVVNGDVVVAGGMLTVHGTINGQLRAMGGVLIMRGTVKGRSDIRVDEANIEGTLGDTILVATKLTTGPNARIGNLGYWLKSGPRAFTGVVLGQAEYRENLRPVHHEIEKGAAAAFAAVFLGFELLKLLSGIVLILLLLLLTRTYFVDAGRELHARPGRSAWRGFLFFALTPIIAILCFVSLVGIPIGLFLFFYYGFVLMFLKAVCAIVLARWIEIQWKQKWTKPMVFLWSVIIYIGLKILCWIPFLGWLLMLAIAFLVIGAVMTVKHERYLKVR